MTATHATETASATTTAETPAAPSGPARRGVTYVLDVARRSWACSLIVLAVLVATVATGVTALVEIGIAVARAYMPDAGLWDWIKMSWQMVVPRREP